MKISELEVIETPSDDDLIVVDAHYTSESYYDTKVMRRDAFLAGYVEIYCSNDNYQTSSNLPEYLHQYLESNGVITSDNFMSYIETHASNIAAKINPYISI